MREQTPVATITADVPMVVLVGERTASAAETAAATIGETGRGVLIGSTMYGKGTIQPRTRWAKVFCCR